MPASQLSQLKAALASTGLNRKNYSKQEKKAFKKGGAREVDRQKKVDRLDEIRKSLNKFDERETKVKHDVGGRKLTGVTGRPSAAKQAGLEQRKKSLLPEHQLRGHSGTFNDRRFGESNPGLSLDEKMQERYTREQQRGQGRKGMFNLEEEGMDLFGMEEDGAALGGLTHGGRSVMELQGDDFDAQGFGEEDDEDQGRVRGDTVRRTHFGGFEELVDDQPEKKRSRQEIMNEVMAKSKEHKYARQQQAEEDANIRDELDADIADLQLLLGDGAGAGPSRVKRADEDGYDQYVREMAYDARAKPKDRTKSEVELAGEEKTRLEEAEAKRLRRMRGESEEEEEGRKRKRGKGDADDLEDDFEEEELLGPGLTREDLERMGGAQGDGEGEGEEEEGEGDEEDEEDEEDDDDEEEDDDDEEEDDDDEEEDDDDDDDDDQSSMADLDDAPDLVPVEEGDFSLVKSKKRKAATQPIEIPFTFACPADIEEFEEIMEPLNDSALPTVVQRIRALHHPSLAQGNKDKLLALLGVLLDYSLILAARSPPAFSLISQLHPHIIALVRLDAISAAHHFLAKLTLMQKNLVRGLARGAADPDARTWPGAPELVLLRLVGAVWSTSDFSHPVVAPTMLLMGQYLSQCRLRSETDLAAGLFLCSLVAEYEAESRRIVPEAINFIGDALMATMKRKGSEMVELYAEGEPGKQADLGRLLEGRGRRADLLATALKLVSTFATLYSGQEAFIELMSPLKSTLEQSRVKSCKTLHASTLDALTRQLGFAAASRTPLALQAHKPVPIASHAPKFESDYAPGRHYDPDVERNASAKLKAEYKKERKGAIRELRKDNKFLADHRAREQRDKDEAYSARMRKVEGSIQVERAEEKGMEREKAREKRRAGRK